MTQVPPKGPWFPVETQIAALAEPGSEFGPNHATDVGPLLFPEGVTEGETVAKAVHVPAVIAETPYPTPTTQETLLPEAPPPRQQSVVTILGCRGSCGATTLATNLAACLVKQSLSTCVVDLDITMGDVLTALDLRGTRSLSAVAREADGIARAALLRRLTRHETGVLALAQTHHLDDLDPHFGERLPLLLAALGRSIDCVLIDGVRAFDDHSLIAMEMSSTVVLVVVPEIASVRRAQRALHLLRRLGFSDSETWVVLSKTHPSVPVTEAQIVAALDHSIDGVVRLDDKRMQRATAAGRLITEIAGRSDVASDIRQLAEALRKRLSVKSAPVGASLAKAESL